MAFGVMRVLGGGSFERSILLLPMDSCSSFGSQVPAGGAFSGES